MNGGILIGLVIILIAIAIANDTIRMNRLERRIEDLEERR